jgi:hypothetical protein
VTELAHLEFIHDAGPTGSFFMPQALGSGGALFDFDGDGKLDIYLLHNGGPKGKKNQLFRQEEGGRFRDVSEGSGLDVAGYGMGVAIGDVNNDGLPDVLITEYGGIRLFLNLGKGKFKEITREAGLENPGWGASACFVDYNRDGWLDLVVVNYVSYDQTWPCRSVVTGQLEYCPPRNFPGQVTRLFKNLKQDPVRFEDVTVSTGLNEVKGPGLGVLCADFNGDGWPDIFVANDGAANRLWINQEGKQFKEDAVTSGVAYNRIGQAEAGMGVAWGDVFGDRLFALFVTHITEETHTLWRQEPRGLFIDHTIPSGLVRPRWRATGFGTLLQDFDNDGTLDLAIVNGRIARSTTAANPELGPHWGHYAERNQLFANDGSGRFHDVSINNSAFCGTANVARGLACGDIFGNGAVDLLVTTVAGRARLYRNIAPERGHWLVVRAIDPELKRDAYGAEIRVRAGKRTFIRWVTPGSSYLCSNDPRAHFGLGAIDHIDAIEVLWPDGREEEFEGGAVNRRVQLVRKQGHLLPKRQTERRDEK